MIDRDIIIIGQQPWDTEIGSNCKNIALEFSKHNRVLYVNLPLDRITKYKEAKSPKIRKRINIINGKEDGLFMVGDNLWNLYPDCLVESVNWIKNSQVFDFFNRRNNRAFSKSIKKAIERLSFGDYILFNDSEIFKGFYMNELLKPVVSVYYSRDYVLGVEYWRVHGTRLEPKLIRDSDLCVANSEYLRDYCSTYNEYSFNVGQGCDLEIFVSSSGRQKPFELQSINTPIVGYVGALEHSRLDTQLIAYIARNLPDWTIVLVGAQDDYFKESELHRIENIIFTGIKPITDLPGYMQFFDVCINPQLVNEITIGNYPRKIDEYLAMGKPVVATRTQAMEIFNGFVFLSDNKEDYVSMIRDAYNRNAIQDEIRRKEFASSHTWESCVNKIYCCIEAVINKKN